MKNKTFDRCLKIAKPHLKTIFIVSILSIIIDILEPVWYILLLTLSTAF